MKRIILLVLLFISTQVQAQSSDDQVDGSAIQTQFISGSFRHWLGQDSVNVNYLFNPKVANKGLVNVTLHTPTAQPLWLFVSDRSGNKILEWKPQENVYLHNAQIDLSTLPSGEYQYHICFGKELSVKRISFIKK